MQPHWRLTVQIIQNKCWESNIEAIPHERIGEMGRKQEHLNTSWEIISTWTVITNVVYKRTTNGHLKSMHAKTWTWCWTEFGHNRVGELANFSQHVLVLATARFCKLQKFLSLLSRPLPPPQSSSRCTPATERNEFIMQIKFWRIFTEARSQGSLRIYFGQGKNVLTMLFEVTATMWLLS